MLQVYSDNLTMAAEQAFPFNNVVVDKGCAEKLSAPATIQLNQRGVYLVEVDGYATPDAASQVTVQLYVNGVPQPQAKSGFMGTAVTATDNFSFKTFVRVSTNNCPNNCVTSPTILQVMNLDTSLTDAHINVVVTKIC